MYAKKELPVMVVLFLCIRIELMHVPNASLNIETKFLSDERTK